LLQAAAITRRACAIRILAPSSGAVFPLSRNDGAEDANYALQHSMPLLHDSVA
jgi:hypothetical protein